MVGCRGKFRGETQTREKRRGEARPTDERWSRQFVLIRTSRASLRSLKAFSPYVFRDERGGKSDSDEKLKHVHVLQPVKARQTTVGCFLLRTNQRLRPPPPNGWIGSDRWSRKWTRYRRCHQRKPAAVTHAARARAAAPASRQRGTMDRTTHARVRTRSVNRPLTRHLIHFGTRMSSISIYRWR